MQLGWPHGEFMVLAAVAVVLRYNGDDISRKHGGININSSSYIRGSSIIN